MLKNHFKFKFSSNRWFKAMFFNFLCYFKKIYCEDWFSLRILTTDRVTRIRGNIFKCYKLEPSQQLYFDCSNNEQKD